VDLIDSFKARVGQLHRAQLVLIEQIKAAVGAEVRAVERNSSELVTSGSKTARLSPSAMAVEAHLVDAAFARFRDQSALRVRHTAPVCPSAR
jgi:hypothetical protein